MNCWNCQAELIWGGDHDLDENPEFHTVTNLSCPKCFVYVEVYYPREEDEDVECY
jgi:hypothetical protein